jgi:hypothetical protein
VPLYGHPYADEEVNGQQRRCAVIVAARVECSGTVSVPMFCRRSEAARPRERSSMAVALCCISYETGDFLVKAARPVRIAV